MARGEPGALLTTDTEPVKFPAALGSKLALNVALFPGVIVAGVDSPLMPNPAPETLADETVRFAVPVFFSEIVCEFVVPVTTVPKPTLDGVAEIEAAVMVKVRLLVAVCAGELESWTSIVMVKDPDAVGVPEITPDELFSVNPAGSDPLLMLHVYGVVPPLACSVAE